MANKIKLGDRYRDKVSGWEGVATARYEYLNGCVRYEIAAADEKGHPVAFVFDEEQLETPAGKVPAATSRHGGPQTSAPVTR